MRLSDDFPVIVARGLFEVRIYLPRIFPSFSSSRLLIYHRLRRVPLPVSAMSREHTSFLPHIVKATLLLVLQLTHIL